MDIDGYSLKINNHDDRVSVKQTIIINHEAETES